MTRVTEAHKLAEIETRDRILREGRPEFFKKPFGQAWESAYWTKWATIDWAFERLGVREGAEVLDVGSGTGWTTLFLAESGYVATGVDIAPGNIEISTTRAKRWSLPATFQEADMDYLDLERTFDAALVFDALHHSTRQAEVVSGIAKHLRPGGWVLFGEPSLLHAISPHAFKARRDEGWTERGISVRRLRRHCREAGLGDFRRFYEGPGPYESTTGGFLWQLTRLVASNVAFAPQTSIWLAARKLGPGANP